MIGSERKEARLRYLKNYWMDALSDIQGIRFFTSKKPEFSCGLANFGIDGMEPADIQKKLLSQYKIYTVAMVWENINGIRVTPNVYTTTADLDKFIRAVHEIAATSLL
jgi:selenocysteine lyase/cysteine desulfurase